MERGPDPLIPEALELACVSEFKSWLTAERGLTGRALGDVVSRTRRTAKWLDILGLSSDDEAMFKLSQDPHFRACSPGVQSQLKRAVLLYRKFRQARKSSLK
jgi:hypothetical protein